MALCRNSLVIRRAFSLAPRLMSTGEMGDGAGKGGGTGGAIRDAGGSFGKMEAAREEEYFRKKQVDQLRLLRHSMGEEIRSHEEEIKHHKTHEQLRSLHDHLEVEVSHHEDQIKRHKEAIERHKKRISALKHEEEKHKRKHDD